MSDTKKTKALTPEEAAEIVKLFKSIKAKFIEAAIAFGLYDNEHNLTPLGKAVVEGAAAGNSHMVKIKSGTVPGAGLISVGGKNLMATEVGITFRPGELTSVDISALASDVDVEALQQNTQLNIVHDYGFETEEAVEVLRDYGVEEPEKAIAAIKNLMHTKGIK